MASPDDTQSLGVRRIIPAPQARVYDAWTTPELLREWFAPGTDFTVVVHSVETRVGGKYRIEMRNAKGDSHVAAGEYRE
jgi:uncharacterized protein YndB with AHSA1/START domain